MCNDIGKGAMASLESIIQKVEEEAKRIQNQ